MNVYGYARISRDEVKDGESIENQKIVLSEFAKKNKIKYTEIMTDNDITGFTFDRPSLNKLKDLMYNNELDILIVKDISRLGRKQSGMLRLLEELWDFEVQLISIEDGYDSKGIYGSSDDSMLGIKAWVNEMYSRDISKKVKSSIKAKQTSEGLVIVPPFGYIKDKKTKEIIIDEEVADVVRLMFKLYTQGYGTKKIAQYLNDNSYITPALQKSNQGVNGRKTDKQRHLYHSTTVSRILKNDAYIGILRCGTTKLTRIKGKRIKVDPEEHIIHENYYPPIITKQQFNLVQEMFEKRKKGMSRAKDNLLYKYTGILVCGDCGMNMVSKKRTKNNKTQKAYICTTYNKYGKNQCTSHSIYEKAIDKEIQMKLNEILDKYEINVDAINKEIERLQKKNKNYNSALNKIRLQIDNKKEEIKNYSKQLAKNLISEDIFKELIGDSNNELKIFQQQINELEELRHEEMNTKENMIWTIEVLKKIKNKKELTYKDVTILIDKITITDTGKRGKWSKPVCKAKIEWKIPFIPIKIHHHGVELPYGNIIPSELWEIEFNKAYKQFKNIINIKDYRSNKKTQSKDADFKTQKIRQAY